MLKSTYKPKQSSSDLAPLPPGWTEHTAPTGVFLPSPLTVSNPSLLMFVGHAYFSNTTTKESTYTRPTAPTQPHLQGASPSYISSTLPSGWTEHKAPTGVTSPLSTRRLRCQHR